MALLTVADSGKQYDIIDRGPTGGDPFQKSSEAGGELRTYVFDYVNDSGAALSANDIVRLGPIENCRILGGRLEATAFGASRTLDVGLQEYTNNGGDTVASEIDAIADGVDVSSASNNFLSAVTSNTNLATDTTAAGLFVHGRSDVLAKVIGGTLPTNARIRLVLEVVPVSG